MYHTMVGSTCRFTSLKVQWEAGSPMGPSVKCFGTGQVSVTGLGHGLMIFRFALGNKVVTDDIIPKETQKIKYTAAKIKYCLSGPKKMEQTLVCCV